MGEAMEFSKMLAESSMVPRAYQGKPQDIMVCVQWGYELGLAPMQALQNIAVINGKPSVYGDAMMALVQASPVCEGIDEHIENEGTPNPVAVCIAKRKGRNPVIARFSVEDAKRAGLWGKQGPWQAYPKRMLQMRARGFALRDAFPDVLKGLITAEEAADFPEEAKPRERDVTPAKPANPLDAIVPPPSLPEPELEPEPLPEPIEIELIHVDFDSQNDSAESAEQVAELVVLGDWPLMVPGKEQPFSVHASQQEWQQAYEDLADKTAKAGKRPARERMTILKELREVNELQLKRINSIERMRHTASYSGRINALGAAVPPGEK
jgi:hypothetical protein